MADRGGNCKFFSPNYFNKTKCQNCFKPKDQHTQQQQETPPSKQPLSRKASSLNRNTSLTKTVLKESVLWKGVPIKDGEAPKNWEKHWFSLLSDGELQQYAITEGQINKDVMENSMMLQDFIRMLDGKLEISEDSCFGVKTLRDTVYFKTNTKVDYENWWKEFSSFVAAPIKRTTSTASALRSKARSRTPSYSRAMSTANYTKPKINHQHSVPSPSLMPKFSTKSSRSSSVSSLQSEPDHPQMETLRNQVSKLEEENSKLSKAEEQRRKLELEVNYWKEYVTNSQSLKRAGATFDAATELADSRRKFLQLQDELNETQKKLKTNTGKMLMQNKEIADYKEKLLEANSIIAVHKAKIDHLTKELKQKDGEKGLIIPAAANELFYEGVEALKTHETPVPRPVATEGISSNAQHLEDKFLVLKDRLKRIERELFLKSKELEKANESRSKVAKYTRSLLQELETRLSDNQQKLSDTDEKLKNANMELSMERERRIKLEDGPRRRMSSVASPLKYPVQSAEILTSGDPEAPPTDLSEHDADTKYADYYRSRFKEAEASLLEKDKKLHQAEEKIKEIQLAMKSNSDSYKVINDLQSKLSDATHKLSDRQLKIHELTQEIDRIKEFEKTYTKKSKQVDTLEDIVKDLELKNSEQKKALHHLKQELEMVKIREVVLNEQLQTFAEDSENSDEELDDDEEDDGEEDDVHSTKLGKSIALKKKIECMIELEALSKKLTIDNEKLTIKNAELETRLRNINMQSFKSIEASKSLADEEKGFVDGEKENLTEVIKELERKLGESEEKYCKVVTDDKDKYFHDIATFEKKCEDEKTQMSDAITKLEAETENMSKEKVEMEGDRNELRGKLTMLQLKFNEVEENLSKEVIAHNNSKKLLEEQSDLLYRPDGQDSKRSSYTSIDGDYDEKYDLLSSQNHGLQIKIRQLERQLRLSSEKFEDVMSSLKEKGTLLDNSKHDRDSGIVITQEIKNIIDSYSKDATDGVVICADSQDVSMTPETNVPYESESIDKYKRICKTYDSKVKDLSEKLISSEQKVIKLAEELHEHIQSEEDYITNYDALITRIEDLQAQIIESQESLQSKADELERERKNVINLVEVTSAYIKELEGSLVEYKAKVQDLQANRDVTQGTGEKPESSDTVKTEGEEEDVSLVKERLTAKILMLQSDLSELRAAQAESEPNKQESIKSSDDDQPENSESQQQIISLEEQLKEQREDYEKEMVNLQEQYNNELKAAFSGDTGGMEMLNRIQELEMEVVTTRNESENQLKEMQEQYEAEKQQMKEDMATVLQASLSINLGGGSQEPPDATSEEYEERIIKLEEELIDMKEKYDEELEMEKDAHQKEMEDTIRDMMILRNLTSTTDIKVKDTDQTTKYKIFMLREEKSTMPRQMYPRPSMIRKDSKSTPENIVRNESKLKNMFSVDEVDDIKMAYEKKLELQMEDHEDELTQVRQDMAIVISSLKQGSSSDTIMDLQARIKDLEQEIEYMRSDFAAERKDLELKVKKADSKSFFTIRRNEEMGSSIYKLQVELEEFERKHQLEIQAYQDRLASLGEDVDSGVPVHDSLQLTEELQEKNKDLEQELDNIRDEHEDEMQALTVRLQEEKREAIEEMTDKVLKLESLIDEIKDKHSAEIENYEKLVRSENLEIAGKDKERINELEVMCENLKEEYGEEIEELAKEHRKEVEKLRLFYEKEIGEIKKRTSSEVENNSNLQSRRSSVDHNKYGLKEQKEKFEKEIEAIKQKYIQEKESMVETQQREIDNIRIQYDEKLKMSYKEGLRRHSVSERKSDATKMRELIAEKEASHTRFLELEIKYETDTRELHERIVKLQKIISDLKGGLEQEKGIDLSKQTLDSLVENENLLHDESQKKLKEINEQIERYERRIEYYREKSQRENTEESHRVSELQSEIVELYKELDEMKQKETKAVYDKERKEKEHDRPTLPRRNTDGSTPRRHTDTEAMPSQLRERDPKKRWSNLEERTEVISRSIAELDGKRNPKLVTSVKMEQNSTKSSRARIKDEGKSGTVLARKTLWENIKPDEPASAKPKLAKAPSVK